jgi:spore germination protein YaaH
VLPRSLTAAALTAGALLLPAAAPGGAAAATSCPSVKATNLKLAASTGAADRVIVSWRAPRRHPAKLAYRVARDGAVVGQTRGRRMSVAVAPGTTPKISVTAIVAGRRTRCVTSITAQAGDGGTVSSTTAAGLAVRPGGRGKAVLTWDGPSGGAPGGYRILRDGRLAQRVKATRLVVRTTKRSVRYQVAVLDKKGRRGPRSGAVVVKAGHKRPTAPIAAAASAPDKGTVTLTWGAAKAATRGSRIAGYRVLRADGRTVKGASATSATVPVTAAAATYRVIALDREGWASRDSDPIAVAGRAGSAAARPGAPGAPSADAVGDTTVSLSWTPPAGAKLRGYRVLRDGAIVGQVADARAAFGNLAAKSAHDWSVAAIDTAGQVSDVSPATHVVQADPPATRGVAQAFLLASTDSSFAAFRRTYQQIGVVYPTYFDCDRATAAIEGADNPDIDTFAQDRKVKLMPRLNCQSTPVVHQILTDPATRSAWLDGTLKLVRDHGYDGVNLDFEAVAASDRDALTSFVSDLADRLHAEGKLLSQAVSPKVKDDPNHSRSGAFDYIKLAQHVDYVFVMAWGQHWSTSAPGPLDDVRWVRQIADYVTSLPDHDKYVLGTMLYGMDWPGDGGADQPADARHYPEVQALVARTGATPTYDPNVDAWTLTYDENGTTRTVWYPDATTTVNRIGIARDHGLGIGFWRLGQEDDRVWSDPRLVQG